jgi:hypothetical protein
MKRLTISILAAIPSFLLGTILVISGHFFNPPPKVAAGPSQPVFINGSFVPEEIIEIKSFVAAVNKDPIISIARRDDGLIEVQTGMICGSLCGHGTLYRIKNEGSKWIIQYRGYWMS